MKRIICIGNRLRPDDDAGPMVFDRLRVLDLPPDVELIDGGLGGLNLLDFLEGADRVVFVDRVSGFAGPGESVLLEGDEVAALAEGGYDHAAGLPYLLRVMPTVCDAPAEQVLVLGIEGRLEGAAADKMAETALRLVQTGRPEASADLRPFGGGE